MDARVKSKQSCAVSSDHEMQEISVKPRFNNLGQSSGAEGARNDGAKLLLTHDSTLERDLPQNSSVELGNLSDGKC